jgi:hypothetical protein
MITDENDTGAAELKSRTPALEIRIQFVDGSKETFVQANTEPAESILHRFDAFTSFHQTRIIIADDYSKSVFVCSQINRVDFIFDDAGFSRIPSDYADLVELTEAEFNQRVPVNEPARLQRRDQQRHVGDLMVSFLHLRMRGGSHVYLMDEAVVKLPADNQSYMQRLLSKGVFGIRLAEGGQGFLNLENLVGYTVYPGVREVPVDTWMAQPKRD